MALPSWAEGFYYTFHPNELKQARIARGIDPNAGAVPLSRALDVVGIGPFSAARGASVGLGSAVVRFFGTQGTKQAARTAVRTEGSILSRGLSRVAVYTAGGAAAVGVGSWGLSRVGDATGGAANDIFSGLGGGLGEGLDQFGTGLADAAHKLLVPALVVAGAFVAVKLLTAPRGAKA